MREFDKFKESLDKFFAVLLSDDEFPLEIRNQDKAQFLGLDIETLLRDTITDTSALQFVEIRKSGHKINIKFKFNSHNPHEVKISFKDFDNGKYSMDMIIGDKAVRVDAKINQIDDDRFRLFFKKLGEALEVVHDKYDLDDYNFSFENRQEIIDLFDSINKLLID